jgi:hypothetical protein
MHRLMQAPFRPPQSAIQSLHRRGAGRGVALSFGLCLLLACTTPDSAGRLLFRRGATDLPETLVWQEFSGQTNIDMASNEELLEQLKNLITARVIPIDTDAQRSLRLQSVIVGCRQKPRAACACRVVVELLGSDQTTALRGMEGRAELAMAGLADAQGLQRALPTLFNHALRTALAADDKRPPAYSQMERAARRQDHQQFSAWADKLAQPGLSEARRIALWITLGHIGIHSDLPRLSKTAALSPGEALARQRALAWIGAASRQAGKSVQAHVESRPGANGDSP